MRHSPLSRVPSSAAKQAGDSTRGQHSQSIVPSLPTRATVSQLPTIAYSSRRMSIEIDDHFDVVGLLGERFLPPAERNAPADQAFEPVAVRTHERARGGGVVPAIGVDDAENH